MRLYFDEFEMFQKISLDEDFVQGWQCIVCRHSRLRRESMPLFPVECRSKVRFLQEA